MVYKTKKYAGLTVVEIGNGKPPRQKPVPLKTLPGPAPVEAPLKHEVEHLAGKTAAQSDCKNHEKWDSGIPIKKMAAVITWHINAGLIDTDNPKTMENFIALYAALEKLQHADDRQPKGGFQR